MSESIDNKPRELSGWLPSRHIITISIGGMTAAGLFMSSSASVAVPVVR